MDNLFSPSEDSADIFLKKSVRRSTYMCFIFEENELSGFYFHFYKSGKAVATGGVKMLRISVHMEYHKYEGLAWQQSDTY